MVIRQSLSKHWLAALGFGVFASQAAIAVPTLTAAATPQPALVGSTVSVNVSIAEITDLYAWQFTLGFDPSVLRFVSASAGSFLGAPDGTFFSGGVVDNTVGTVSFAVQTLIGQVPGASGSGLLGSFVFDVAGAGTSPIGFSNVLFLDSGLLDITVQSVDTSVLASAVPEPATALLLALGFGLAGLAARRRA